MLFRSLPTFLKEYPIALHTQLHFFNDYNILPAYTPPERRLISTARVAPTFERRSALEIAVDNLSLPTIKRKTSYRVKVMLS